jgi:hypothetical protein
MAASARTSSHPDRTGAHTPIRTCIGCRRKAAAAELLRVVASGRQIVPDPRHRAPGRGAWLHRDPDCVDLAERRRACERALHVSGPLDLAAVREHVQQFGQPTGGTPQETTAMGDR